jgi:hypothetical protein
VTAVGPQPSASLQQELYPSYSVAVTLGADFSLTTAFTAGFARELYVGGAGDVVAQLYGDAAPQTYKAVPVGTILRGLFTLVKSTGNGTTASNILARY